MDTKKLKGEGVIDQVKGRVKTAVGALTGNDELEGEGAADRTKGTVKEKGADLIDKVRDAVNGPDRKDV